MSRLDGGIYFRAAIDVGMAQGREIGRAVNALPLRTGRPGARTS